MFEYIISCWTAIMAYADDHGAGLAAISALVAIPFLLAQITQNGRQDRRRIRARRLAALSTLPITLSGINAWAKAAADSQVAIYPWAKRTHGSRPFPTYKPPPSPSHLIDAIERMIEADPKHRIALTLAAIVADIQVLSARLGENKNFTEHKVRGQMLSIDDNLIRAAAIYSRAESLYDDARKLSDGVPLDYVRMGVALSIMDIREGSYEDVHLMLSRAAKRDRLRNRSLYEKFSDHVKGKLAILRLRDANDGNRRSP